MAKSKPRRIRSKPSDIFAIPFSVIRSRTKFTSNWEKWFKLHAYISGDTFTRNDGKGHNSNSWELTKTEIDWLTDKDVPSLLHNYAVWNRICQIYFNKRDFLRP